MRSAEDALKKSELDIIELIDVSLEKRAELCAKLQKERVQNRLTLSQLKEASTGSKGGNFIKTGVKTLDEALRGTSRHDY